MIKFKREIILVYITENKKNDYIKYFMSIYKNLTIKEYSKNLCVLVNKNINIQIIIDYITFYTRCNKLIIDREVTKNEKELMVEICNLSNIIDVREYSN